MSSIPQNTVDSSPKNTNRNIRITLLILIILATLSGVIFAFLLAKNRHQSNQLLTVQNNMQQALDNEKQLQDEHLETMAREIRQLRQDQKDDISKQLQDQYDQIIQRLETLSKSDNGSVSTVANDLLAQLSNQAGDGIGISGPNNTTITNKGVITINNKSGDVSLQGVQNQTTVTQNGNTITVGTAQDIAQTSSPTFNNQTLTGNQTVQGSVTASGLSIGSTGTQNGYQICDSSNNCGYSGAGYSFVQGGNSYGAPANLGTNDNNPLHIRTNGSTRITVDGSGNTNFTGDVSSGGIISGNGSGLTNINAGSLSGGTVADSRLSSNVTIQGNTFNGANQLVQLTAGGLLPALDGSNLQSVDASSLGGQSASYYTNASNIANGTLGDNRLSSNVALKNSTNTFTGTNNFAGITATGILQNGYQVCDASNNCNYATSGQFANAILQGGNSFGTQMTIGTNDNQAFAIKTNGTERLKVLSSGSVLVNTSTQRGYGLSVESTTGVPFSVVDNYYGYSIGGMGPANISWPNNNYWGVNRNSSQTYYTNSSGSHIFGTVATNSGGIIIQGGSAQTYDLFQIKNSANTVVASFDKDGRISAYGGTDTQPGLRFQDKTNSGFYLYNNNDVISTNNGQWSFRFGPNKRNYINTTTNSTSALTIVPGASTDSALVLQGASGQTANLQEWRNSTGSVITLIDSNGNIGLTQPNAKINIGSSQSGYVSIGTQSNYSGNFINRTALCMDTACLSANGGGQFTVTNHTGSQWSGVLRSNSINTTTIRSFDNGALAMNIMEILGNTKANVGFNANANTTNSALFGSSSISNTNLAVRGLMGQIADLVQAQDSSGAVLASISASGNLTVKSATIEGAYITFSNNIRGYNVAVSASATSQTVSFGTAHSDANYAVFCTPDWNTTCYVTNKTVNGFTLNYGTPAPAGQLVDWFVAR